MSTPAPLPPGLVWTTAPYSALLKKSGLISAQLAPTIDHGLKLYALQLTPDHIRQAATQLAAGRTAMGPLSELEKAKQLRVSASEIRLEAKRVEALLGTAEGISIGWEPWQRCSLASTKPPESLVAWLPVSTHTIGSNPRRLSMLSKARLVTRLMHCS